MINIFSTPILNAEIDQEYFKQIKNYVLESIEKNNKKIRKLWDCDTRTSIHYKILDYNLLNEVIVDTSRQYAEIYGGQVDNVEIVDLWVNIADKNADQEIHEHHCPDNNLSGIIYIETTEESGKTVFYNTNHLLKSLDKKRKNSYYYHDNISGTIVVFPSGLPHYVTQNKTNKPRITLAFNVMVK